MSSGEKWQFGLWFEQFGPFLTGAVTFILLLYFSDWIAERFASHGWNSSGLYSAIFGWSAIQTGFAFGVYGFVIGKTGGFIGALKGTKTMSRFEGYIKRANCTGFILTFSSIPLIVINPSIIVPMSIPYIIVMIWFAFFVWAFLAFLRLAFNFGAMASVKDKEFHGA